MENLVDLIPKLKSFCCNNMNTFSQLNNWTRYKTILKGKRTCGEMWFASSRCIASGALLVTDLESLRASCYTVLKRWVRELNTSLRPLVRSLRWAGWHPLELGILRGYKGDRRMHSASFVLRPLHALIKESSYWKAYQQEVQTFLRYTEKSFVASARRRVVKGRTGLKVSSSLVFWCVCLCFLLRRYQSVEQVFVSVA